MSMIVIPAGRSLRSVAENLGVPIEELRRHSGIEDVEAAMPTERRVTVPDGFLRSRPGRKSAEEALPAESSRNAGMNMWLAMDIEQKRTRAAGGLSAHESRESEELALAEARRAYLRFEAESNDLAIDLYGQATATHSVEVRARGFAGQACALAQRHRLFGESLERSRPQALSAAKAALLANPKLAQAHLAMAMSQGLTRTNADLKEAWTQAEQAVRAGPKDPECWAELAWILEQLGELEAAELAADTALQVDPSWFMALEVKSSLVMRRGDLEDGLDLLEAAARLSTYANALLYAALAMRGAGNHEEAKVLLGRALDRCTRPTHLAFLQQTFASGRFPIER